MAIPENIEVLRPWVAIGDTPEGEARAIALSNRLRRELPQGHLLYGREVRAVATRTDLDDVLFEVDVPDNNLAVVHLTWRKETDPRWPATTLYRDWQHWAVAAMQRDHEDFVRD